MGYPGTPSGWHCISFPRKPAGDRSAPEAVGHRVVEFRPPCFRRRHHNPMRRTATGTGTTFASDNGGPHWYPPPAPPPNLAATTTMNDQDAKVRLLDLTPGEQVAALHQGEIDLVLIGQEGATLARDFFTELSHSLLARGAGSGRFGLPRVPCARLPEEPAAVIPHAGIHEGGHQKPVSPPQ